MFDIFAWKKWLVDQSIIKIVVTNFHSIQQQ